MARKLKTYQTSLGFFDLAIAAPSMKAALEAWGADSNLFHQGAAKESDDPDVIAATMAKPGVVLRRPVGSINEATGEVTIDGPMTKEQAGARKAVREQAIESLRRYVEVEAALKEDLFFVLNRIGDSEGSRPLRPK
jgi:hypothetical protein